MYAPAPRIARVVSVENDIKVYYGTIFFMFCTCITTNMSYRSIDNLASLTNTNLGLEATRAESVESSISARLQTYITNNDQAASAFSASTTSALSAETARAVAAETVGSNAIATLITQNVTVQSAVDSLTSQYTSNASAIAAEASRAAAAETTLTQNLESSNQTVGSIVRGRATDATTMNGLQSSVNTLTASLGDESTRALAAEAGISGGFAAVNTSIATNSTAIAAIVASQTTDEGSIAALQTAVSALSDSLDFQDVTLAGVWSNTGHTSYQVNMRVVRTGGCVTVTLAAFNSEISMSNSACTYSLAVPAWAVPDYPVECSVVVSTSGNSSAGCAVSDANGVFSIFPFNGNWGASGGINSASCFTYTLVTGSVAQSSGSSGSLDSKGN